MGSALQPTPELFANSEVEPWVDGYPGDLDGDGVLGDVVAGIWQQDRWSNGGSRDNRGAISFDSGATWQAITFAGITECTGGPFDRDTDPWLTFAPNGDLHIMHLGLDIDAPPGQPGGFGANAMLAQKIGAAAGADPRRGRRPEHREALRGVDGHPLQPSRLPQRHRPHDLG